MANNPKVLTNLNTNQPSFVSATITPFFQSKNVRVDLSGFIPVNNFANYDYDTPGFAGVGVVTGTTTVSPIIITLSKPVREFEFTIFAPNVTGHQFIAYDSSNTQVAIQEIVTETEYYTTRRIQLATTTDAIQSIRLISPMNDVVDYFINGIRSNAEDALNLPTPTPTATHTSSTAGTPPVTGAVTTPKPTPSNTSSVSGETTGVGGLGGGNSTTGGSDSPTLAAYIEAEIRAETRKQYPELNYMEQNPEMLKSLKVLSVAMARAIKKYLNQDVKTVQLELQVDSTGLDSNGLLVNPNPHSHDIVAP